MSSDNLCVADLMTRDVATLNQNDKLVIADDVMRLGRIRHIIVVDDQGQLAGLVSQRDLFHSGLLRALGYGTHAKKQVLESLLIKEAMHTEVITARSTMPLRGAARLMAEKKIGCLPVVDDGKLVGIITEGDFVAWAAGIKGVG